MDMNAPRFLKRALQAKSNGELLALAPRGNPRLSTLVAVIKAIGLKLTVKAA